MENLGLAVPGDAKRAAELIYQSDAPFYDYWFALPRELTLINLARLWHEPNGSYSYRNAQVLRNAQEEIIALVFHYPAGYGAQLQIDDSIELHTLALDLDILRARQRDLDFLFPHVPNDTWYLRTIAVHEDHRSQGLGARMLSQVIYTARQAGFDQLHVDVDSGNPGAVQFYRRHGFEVLVESKVRTLTQFSLPASLRMVKSL